MTLKSTPEISSVSEEGAKSSLAQAQPSTLSIFHEDILLAILSFVADVPFEIVDKAHPIDSHSSLTHTLPLVSKQIHSLTRRHDLHWKNALLRLVRREPTLWEEGLKRVVFDAKCDELRGKIIERNQNSATAQCDKRMKDGQTNQRQQRPAPQSILPSSNSDQPNGSSDDADPPLASKGEILQHACAAIQSHPSHHRRATSSGIYQYLYQSVLLGHMRYQAPVFCMPSRVRLGSPYGLHLFEPRYRLMISEVMASYPASARRGERILPMVQGLSRPNHMADDIKASTRDLLEKNELILHKHHVPTFIHAHQAPMRRSTPATVVQVQQCVIHPNGSADVFLKPLSYIWLEEIWERSGTGGLYEAMGLRMGEEASESYERWCGMRGFGRGDGRGRGQMLPIP